MDASSQTLWVAFERGQSKSLPRIGIPGDPYAVTSDHVEVAWRLLEEMIEEGEVVEQYPTYDGTVVERTPLA